MLKTNGELISTRRQFELYYKSLSPEEKKSKRRDLRAYEESLKRRDDKPSLNNDTYVRTCPKDLNKQFDDLAKEINPKVKNKLGKRLRKVKSSGITPRSNHDEKRRKTMESAKASQKEERAKKMRLVPSPQRHR